MSREDQRERQAKNEAVFRALNENILGLASTLGGQDQPYEFICECATLGCLERLSMTLQEFEDVRVVPARFVLAPGHQDIAVEAVVEDHGGFIVVEKAGVAGDVSGNENPHA